jgi:hypothetical protein
VVLRDDSFGIDTAAMMANHQDRDQLHQRETAARGAAAVAG